MPLATGILWYRSYHGYLALRRERHIAQWPDGRSAAWTAPKKRWLETPFASGAGVDARITSIASDRGKLVFYYTSFQSRHDSEEGRWEYIRWFLRGPPYHSDWRLRPYRSHDLSHAAVSALHARKGIDWQIVRKGTPGSWNRLQWVLVVRHWLLLVLASIPLLLITMRTLTRRLMRIRRIRRGRCGTCGYDLRASPERCPECGTPRPRTEPAAPQGDVRA